MAQPFHIHLANALRHANRVADHQIIRSNQLPRIERERLLKGNWLEQIIRGWYLLRPPHVAPGESTPWYANFWHFIKLYLEARFGSDYCLSPESSLDLYLDKNWLPQQVIVMTKKGGSMSLVLPHHTSLLLYEEKQKFPSTIQSHRGINVLPFEYALCKMPQTFYQKAPQEATIALQMLDSPDTILYFLLKEGMVQSAGRIIAGLRQIDRNAFAETVAQAMKAAGFTIMENKPLTKPHIPLLPTRKPSPYSLRIEQLWHSASNAIRDSIPQPTLSVEKRERLINNIEAIYIQDAYHSLSIENYQVSEALIEKIAKGEWHPDKNKQDQQQQNAMAAKGYLEAFKQVKQTIQAMLKHDDPMMHLQQSFPNWYFALFSPAVQSGLIKAEHLAGFRRHAVYIRHAAHVPPPYDTVCDCMETLFQCMASESHPGVNAILAHWLIGFIHPYMDGNGRMARFMMNALLCCYGYPWTIIRVETRSAYLAALEKASIHCDLSDFTRLVLNAMQQTEKQT